MYIPFYKYQGAGNDFIIIDNRILQVQLTTEQIAMMCDRRYGIGADGLMYLENEAGYDFKMVYFNADGNESTMCGNGGRCIVLFARKLDLFVDHTLFIAIDGKHDATLMKDGNVALGMKDVTEIDFVEEACILDTGSPHIVVPVEELVGYDVYNNGKRIRNEARFGDRGINVNFISMQEDGLHIRTYERGVEDETLACGTGVTAAAISTTGNGIGTFIIPVVAKGGNLQVSFTKETAHTASQIVLTGPAAFVFEGGIEM